ncbi:MAG: T9SS type A sorting domain-containing protein [Bacteroidota bacterium]
MTILKNVCTLFCIFVLAQSFGQRPEYDLPEHTNENFIIGEPPVCSSQSQQAPINLTHIFYDDGVMLKWDAVPKTFGCQVKGGIVGQEETVRYKEGFERLRMFFSFSSLEPNQNYQWKVRCNCKNEPWHWGEFSEYSFFTSPNFDLPYDPDQADQIVLFPNPTENELNLHFNKTVGENSFMEIYTVNGILNRKLPLKSGLNFIDTTDLERGYYILYISTMEEIHKISFVKT